MGKLEVISTPYKRLLKQQELLIRKTGGDKHTIKITKTTGTTDGKTGGDKHTIKKTETTGTTDW